MVLLFKKGSWEKGSKIYFLGIDEDGKHVEIGSEIAVNRPFSFVSIRNYGNFDSDKEITENEEVKK